MTEPIKRRPGRPRKHPLPEAPAPEVSETPEPSTEVPAAPVEPKKDVKPPAEDPSDPHIGYECHPTASHVGFEDGSLYEAKDGFVVKRVS